MKTIKLKYDSSKYEDRLACEMIEVERIYNEYKQDETNNHLYQDLKEAIYMLQIATKVKVAEGSMRLSDAEEMREYYWGLLL